MKFTFLAAGLLALASMPAWAQTEMVSTSTMMNGYATTKSFSGTRIAPSDDTDAAHDGCTNIPGVAHNSADCSVLNWMDPNTVLPDKPLDQLSGAEENLIRSYNILVKERQVGEKPRPRTIPSRQ